MPLKKFIPPKPQIRSVAPGYKLATGVSIIETIGNPMYENMCNAAEVSRFAKKYPKEFSEILDSSFIYMGLSLLNRKPLSLHLNSRRGRNVHPFVSCSGCFDDISIFSSIELKLENSLININPSPCINHGWHYNNEVHIPPIKNIRKYIQIYTDIPEEPLNGIRISKDTGGIPGSKLATPSNGIALAIYQSFGALVRSYVEYNNLLINCVHIGTHLEQNPNDISCLFLSD